MGQTLTCYECFWNSVCHSNVGISLSLFCCSCWMAMPEAMAHMRGSEGLKMGCNQGYGYSCLCCGEMLCVPEWLALYSVWQSIGEHRGRIYDVDVQPAGVVPQGFGGQGGQPYGGQPYGGQGQPRGYY